MAAEKAAWRGRFRAARRAAPASALSQASGQIAARLRPVVGAALAERGGAVALFWPLPGEVDLRPLAAGLRRAGVAVALPAVAGPRRLAWRAFGGADGLVDGPWGLREPPATAAAVAPGGLAVVVVPGLAFGRDGSRLGYGAGFYDAALARTPALAVGVAVSSALVDAVPTEPHDRALDAVVTEREVAWTGR